MLKTLLHKQMTEIFRSYVYDAKKNRKRSKAATIGLIVLYVLLMVGLMGGIFTFLSLVLCGQLAELGLSWMYFALMGLIAVFLGAFGSVFNTYAGLYLSKDNDLLLSLPIPVRYIMLSRLLSVYLMGLMYSAVVIVPAVIVYWITVPVTAAAVVGGVLLTLLISLIVMLLSCLLGWLVAKISLKLRHKSIVTVLVSLVFFGAYYFISFRAQALIADLLTNAVLYGSKIKGAAYPLYLFGRVGEGDGLSMLVWTAAVLVLFALMWTLISRSFLKIATASGKTAKAAYKETASKVRGISGALFAKELARFTGSPNYMLNCGLGVLLLPVCGVVILIKGAAVTGALNAAFAGKPGCTAVLMCAAVCMLASMNDMAAPSVSLEGKNLWLAQSLPILPWQALAAKLRLQIALTSVPTLICAICVAAVSGGTAVEAVLFVVCAVLFTVMMAAFGLFLGIKMPNLNWTNEIMPIKQSAGVTFALLGGWAYSAALAGLFLWIGWRMGAAAYLAAAVAVTGLLFAVLLAWLKRWGAQIFAAL